MISLYYEHRVLTLDRRFQGGDYDRRFQGGDYDSNKSLVSLDTVAKWDDTSRSLEESRNNS